MALVVFSAALLVQCIGAWTDSQTTDEAVHLSAGLSYWRTGDFRLNPEHPPLIKLLAALPLLPFRNLPLMTSGAAWNEPNEWTIGAHFLYRQSMNNFSLGRLILFGGRLPIILLWAAFGVTLYFCCRRWGEWAATLALVAFAADPNWLGHGHLVTTDVGVAAAFFFVILAVEAYVRRPTWGRVSILAGLFAAAQVTKFSALILWLIVPVLGWLALAYHPSVFRWRHWWRMMGMTIGAGLIVTWAVYGFEVKSMTRDRQLAAMWQSRRTFIAEDRSPSDRPFLERVIVATPPGTWFGNVIDHAGQWSVPAYSYWRGIIALDNHQFWGHDAFLLGQASTLGWWYYFPVAFAVKTPLLTVLALLASAGFGMAVFTVRCRARRPWRAVVPLTGWMFGLPPIVFFLWSMTSHINIGVRHIFPVYPFVWMAVGRLASKPFGRLRPWMTALVIGGGLIVTAAAAWPHTIGYFNALAGGTSGGHRILLDSNLDWNQDIWRLQSWLRHNQVTSYSLALFGSIPQASIFPQAKPIPGTSEVDRGIQPTWPVIISAGQLYNLEGPFRWLRGYRPDTTIGTSIYVFDAH